MILNVALSFSLSQQYASDPLFSRSEICDGVGAVLSQSVIAELVSHNEQLSRHSDLTRSEDCHYSSSRELFRGLVMEINTEEMKGEA